MRTSKHHLPKKLILGTLSLLILVGSTNIYAVNSKDPVKKETSAEKEAIANLTKTYEFNPQVPGEETKNYRIYDAKDNLVHEVRLNKKTKQDEKLVKYLLVADFVMEYGNTRYYKIN